MLARLGSDQGGRAIVSNGLTRPIPEGQHPMNRRLLATLLLGIIIAGCAGVEYARRPEEPFELAILATSDTKGELEPCG